jgi:hypothetical protein
MNAWNVQYKDYPFMDEYFKGMKDESRFNPNWTSPNPSKLLAIGSIINLYKNKRKKNNQITGFDDYASGIEDYS